MMRNKKKYKKFEWLLELFKIHFAITPQKIQVISFLQIKVSYDKIRQVIQKRGFKTYEFQTITKTCLFITLRQSIEEKVE